MPKRPLIVLAAAAAISAPLLAMACAPAGRAEPATLASLDGKPILLKRMVVTATPLPAE